MIRSKLIFGALAAFVYTLLLQCVKGPVAGGSSDTEVSAQISGTVLNIDGNPVSDALVRLRPKDYLPGSRLVKREREADYRSAVDAVTDEYGTYTLDSISDGSYILEVISGDTAGTVVECEMSNAAACTVSTMLKPFSFIKGTVDFTYENGKAKSGALVEVFGTEHLTYTDSTHWFKLQVPEGMHRLRISSDTTYYDDVILNVEVTASDKYLGSIQMVYKPLPACLDYVCDSTVLRKFLDDAGHPDITVEQVSTRGGSRSQIVELNLRNIPILIPLAPLGQLSDIEVLDLGNTGTADSCRFIAGLWELEELRLDSNALTGLSHSIEMMTRLRELNLSNNRIEDLPKGIVNLHYLINLDISGNRLCDVSSIIAGWADSLDRDWREGQDCQ